MAEVYEPGRGRRGVAVRHVVYAGAASLLLVPLAAMRFTPEVNWTAGDFAFAGVLLAVVCGSFELLARKTASLPYRAGAAVALLAALLLVWINAAVGIIGSEQDDANLMFAGVLAVAVGGAVVARFRPAGMARAMVAAAIAQVGVGAFAVAARLGDGSPVWPREIVGLTSAFALMWLAAGWLFGKARVPAR